MMEEQRGIIDRITNRDIVRHQAELIKLQTDAISDFEAMNVTLQSDLAQLKANIEKLSPRRRILGDKKKDESN